MRLKLANFGQRSKKRKFSKFRPRNKTLDEGAKFHVRTMLAEGQSVSHCARVLKCDRKTVRNARKSAVLVKKNLVKKLSKFDESLTLRKDVVEHMALEMDGDLRKYTSVKAIVAHAPFKTSNTTIRRYLRERGVVSRVRPKRPKAWDNDAKRRLKFAIEQLAAINENSRRSYIFSDEKIFDTNERGARRMWIRKGSRAKPRLYQKWAPKVMVWGAVGVNFRKLIFFDGSQRITSNVYVEKILPSVARRSTEDPEMVFIQDGARAHTAFHSMKYLADRKIEAPQWPPRSPDLNVIENLWSLVERQLAGKRGEDERSLEKVVLEAWNAIPTSTINGLVLGFSDRLVKCVHLKGGFVQ